ncbi:CBS domain-containing protein CBSX3, mitochondrial [Iris pallida]|uniref:CBS domain-containing protein CBSX3, mitochondrial n=1 Tax=Iris pallida TaxID=29817 RepID=A0AAX6HXR7_IRIPA|nr:CBS domain-containing protein CBSX3, mitochondrial [Iris pallida]KAJ6845826.1 CBS domain-containing protein CBSX3, mitochondrial [Iris pallida]
MQVAMQAIRSRGNVLRHAVLQQIRVLNPIMRPAIFSRSESVSSARLEEHGFESTTISDILKLKGKSADGSWLWCTTEDTVYDAVKSMTQHNVGALVVVKPGEEKSVAGIITERDYLRKIIVQGRSSKSTKVGDIMTEENKLITVTPDTKVLRAMQLMTGQKSRERERESEEAVARRSRTSSPSPTFLRSGFVLQLWQTMELACLIIIQLNSMIGGWIGELIISAQR